MSEKEPRHIARYQVIMNYDYLMQEMAKARTAREVFDELTAQGKVTVPLKSFYRAVKAVKEQRGDAQAKAEPAAKTAPKPKVRPLKKKTDEVKMVKHKTHATDDDVDEIL